MVYRITTKKRGTVAKMPPNRTTGILCRAIDIDAMMTHSAADEQQTHIPCGTINKTRGRADVGIKSRRNGRRRSGVCQTSATAKKKKPDGFQNWLHVHNACWRIGQHDPVAAAWSGRTNVTESGRP